ncbi:SWITCH1 [Raphanus sativus]|uniref:Protein AMEIOTIC 1 homolog n=1 Tax=Raphanus sativus TaxID=3726 RepID=A0A6J0JVF4_RAPSA|nr:protein AMEIOTIC 1 homolog [Raphanus sativus]KAJ4887842.1 SWITCH1 [Raphanus sativus]
MMMSEKKKKKPRSIMPNRRSTISGWTNKIHLAEDNTSSSSSGSKALVKVKLEKEDKHVSSDTNSSGKALLKVKLEKKEEEEASLHVTRSFLKRKQLSQSVDNNSLVTVKSEHNALDKQRTTLRWNTERFDSAEQAMEDVLKEVGASFENPISRGELRAIARKRIGDTGLLDHLLKHTDGNVTPGGAERFRRCYNTEGIMQYWLESADLIKIKRESGVADPTWVPPSWWNSNRLIKLEPGDGEASFNLKESIEKMKSDIRELVADVVHVKRESGVPDPDLIPLAQWKIKSSAHESSTVSSKLRDEIDKMKSDIKKLVSKPKLPDHSDANEKQFKECMRWKVETDKKMAEIATSLTSTQCMVKELASWKDKVEHQLVGISNSQNNLQVNGSRSPHNWEHLLHSATLDDFTVNGFEPWDVEADLTDVLPEADDYSLPPNARKSSFQDHMWFEEQSVLNSEMQRTESCMTRGDSRSCNQDKAELTPGSSVTAGPRSDIDDPSLLSQETLKELVSWKAKAEQQIMEMSEAVRALQE